MQSLPLYLGNNAKCFLDIFWWYLKKIPFCKIVFFSVPNQPFFFSCIMHTVSTLDDLIFCSFKFTYITPSQVNTLIHHHFIHYSIDIKLLVSQNNKSLFMRLVLRFVKFICEIFWASFYGIVIIVLLYAWFTLILHNFFFFHCIEVTVLPYFR